MRFKLNGHLPYESNFNSFQRLLSSGDNIYKQFGRKNGLTNVHSVLDSNILTLLGCSRKNCSKSEILMKKSANYNKSMK